jgi:hypothetical protein
MTVMPTLEGGLRLDAEDASDWELLRAIVVDANCCKTDLASRLGGLMSEEAGSEDWEELIVPDLREGFQDELAEIGALIESAVFASASGPGPIWITPEDAFPWYSSLNQARLALEEIYHFGPESKADPLKMTPVQRAAFIRSGFYSDIQSLLLRHVMR